MITDQPIDLVEFFSRPFDPSCGAAASFVGMVRNHDHGCRVKSLHYDCYRSMAEKVLQVLADQARSQWAVDEIRIVHRVGHLEIGEAAVAISVGSAHRAEAFEACRFLIEQIKKTVPIWKKEVFEDGTSEWVSCMRSGTSVSWR
ncbi:MAG: molybdenum cofactor biosynthesis protein MoaE [Candidatus Omnitrophica bacterium]|nr:molybdenum cofactor biosynthesis protein MoaE [Candidatus Omnitrophota bacterium]